MVLGTQKISAPQHPDRLEIVPALLDVFVNIEATGQAVEFEQKFSYRRPMYDVMKVMRCPTWLQLTE